MQNIYGGSSLPPQIHFGPPRAQDVAHQGPGLARPGDAHRLARRMLDYACALAAPGVTTDAIDALVHDRIVAAGASQRLD